MERGEGHLGQDWEQPKQPDGEELAGSLERMDLLRDEMWELVREEARELGLPEEEHVAQARQVVARLLEKYPDLAEEVERHQKALAAALRKLSDLRRR